MDTFTNTLHVQYSPLNYICAVTYGTQSCYQYISIRDKLKSNTGILQVRDSDVGGYPLVKSKLHWTKAKTNFTLWFLSLFNVNVNFRANINEPLEP